MGIKKNPKGGKGHRKNKKPVEEDYSKNIEYKEEGEEYAKVMALLGSGRLRVQLPNKLEKLGIIPGRMRKKKMSNLISVDDIILVGIRDYQPDKVDVLYKYNSEQVIILNGKNHLPCHWNSNVQDHGPTDSVSEDECESVSKPVDDTTGIDFDEI